MESGRAPGLREDGAFADLPAQCCGAGLRAAEVAPDVRNGGAHLTGRDVSG